MRFQGRAKLIQSTEGLALKVGEEGESPKSSHCSTSVCHCSVLGSPWPRQCFLYVSRATSTASHFYSDNLKGCFLIWGQVMDAQNTFFPGGGILPSRMLEWLCK